MSSDLKQKLMDDDDGQRTTEKSVISSVSAELKNNMGESDANTIILPFDDDRFTNWIPSKAFCAYVYMQICNQTLKEQWAYFGG